VIEILHASVRGRIRLKVLGLYRSPELKRHIEDKLIRHPEVQACTADSLTGHVLILHPSSGNSSRIILLLQETVFSFHPSDHRPKATGRHPSFYEKFFVDRNHDPERGPFFHTRRKVQALPGKRKTRRLVLRGTVQKAACWHVQSVDALLEEFQCHPEQGLSEQEAAGRLRQYGPNLLPEAVPRSALIIFLRQFQSLPVILLGIASLVSFFTGGWLDTLVIISAILLNALIGFYTENQAEKTFFSLKTLIRPSALVRREGRSALIGAESVVPGDLHILQPGGYISADARLIAVDRLTVDESLLTGESLPVVKTAERLEDEHLPLADRTNMIYMGTLVTGGQGLALALATGRYTDVGRVQILVGQAASPQSPMEKELNRFGGRLTLISLGVCALVFLVGILRGFGLLEMFGSSVALAVAAVPEGLPMVATTALALGVRRMRRYNVLIRNLTAVETLGSVQTLCLDKTGTLTRNRMQVSALFVGLNSYRITDAFIVEDGKGKIDPLDRPELLQLLHVGGALQRERIGPGRNRGRPGDQRCRQSLKRTVFFSSERLFRHRFTYGKRPDSPGSAGWSKRRGPEKPFSDPTDYLPLGKTKLHDHTPRCRSGKRIFGGGQRKSPGSAESLPPAGPKRKKSSFIRSGPTGHREGKRTAGRNGHAGPGVRLSFFFEADNLRPGRGIEKSPDLARIGGHG